MNRTPSDIKVLIAEDDFLIAEEISRILKRLGYQVVGIASNGMKAIDMTSSLHPEVILMDIKLPKLDGIEASRKIIDEMNVAIVILTAHESKDLVDKASEVGIGAYLSKPPKMEEIDRAITIAIARHRDLSESRHLVKQLEEHKKLLSEMNVTKDRFFTIIAHDLRNPVSALMAFTDQLYRNMQEISKDELHQYISIINQTTKSLSELLEELLIWASLQTGRYEFNPVKIHITETFDAIRNLLGIHASQKNIRLLFDSKNDTVVYADRNMLQTITRNLVSNAIKFTPSNGKIMVSSKEENGSVHISISDTGLGMSKEISERLFKINSQISTMGTNGEQGSGLGLILCREMVERNHGKIWVTSQPGKGSCFTFSLPKNQLVNPPAN